MEIEFDPAKNAANLVKHGVDFVYGAQLLAVDRVEIDASRARDGEPRTKAIGLIDGRLFTVVFTLRGETRRIISARRANRSETNAYREIQPL